MDIESIVRAYIEFDEMPDTQGRTPVTKDGVVSVHFYARNRGLTPASNIRLSREMIISTSKPAICPEKKLVMNEMMRDAGLTIRCVMKESDFKPEALDTNSGTNIYIHGDISYEDIFGKTHNQTYCFKLDYRTGKDTAPGWDVVV